MDIPYEFILDKLFDLLGVHALGWIIAAAEAVAIFFLLRWAAREQARWLKVEKERSDMLAKVVRENTATITRQETVLNERTNAMLMAMQTLTSVWSKNGGTNGSR